VNSSARHPLVYCDEWHVLADCARGTGRLHLSWTAQPWQSLLTIAGTRGTIRADLFAATVTSRVARPLPGPAVRLVNTTLEAVALLRQSARSVAAVGLGRLRQYHGVQQLVEEFYRDLASGRPPAVTPGQARSTVVWTEHVARQGDERKRLFTDRCAVGPTADVLVTGATGFVGRRLVTKLLQEGRRVRVLVRREPPPEWWNDPRIEVLYGDLGDPEAVDRAVAGTSLVFHLGAAMRGDAAEFDRSTIAGTRHVVESVLRTPAARLVYMSSLAVLHSAAAREAVTIDESWPLEPRPSARGHYTRTKLAAERIVTEAASERGLQAVVLRPSEIVGPGAPLLTSGVAQRLGRTLVVLGDGTLQVPMVALDDVIDALWRAGANGPFNGVVLHVVDPEPVTQNDVIHKYTRAAGGAWRVVRVPRAIVTAAAGAAELIFALARRSAPLSRYRIASALAPRRFGGARAEAVLGWSPKVGVPGALAAMASAVEQRASADTQR
jgi:nucleoside-diphosphate-sugar epimerase